MGSHLGTLVAGMLVGGLLIGILAHRYPNQFNRLVGPVNWLFAKINGLFRKT